MRLAIIGSCVSRDALAYPHGMDLDLDHYAARTSLGSAFGPGPVPGVDASPIESAFQRRMVEADRDKTLPAYVRRGRYDVLLVDLVDERFDLVVMPDGSVATRSNEYLKAAVRVPGRRVPSGGPEFRERWAAGWEAFLAAVDAAGRRDTVLVNQVRWADTLDGGGPLPDRFDPAATARANEFLAWAHGRMRQDLPARQFLEFGDDDLVAATEHRWGISPFHFTDRYYARLLHLLQARVAYLTV